MPYILVVTMLTAGFVLGVFVSGQYTKSRIERFSSARSVDGFKEHMIKELELTTQQMELLDPMFEAHSKKMDALSKKFRNSFGGEMDNFKKEITPILTEEQIKKLEEHDRQIKFGYGKRPRKRMQPPSDRESDKRPRIDNHQ